MFDFAFADRKGLTPEQMAYEEATDPLAPGRGKYLWAHTEQGWDESLPGRMWEEHDIYKAEKEAGTYDPVYNMAANDPMVQAGIYAGQNPGDNHAFAMSEEDWKNSGHYREGMKYREDMTPQRAEVMARYYDERRAREQLIAAGDAYYGLGMKTLAFGATMLGSLPDPVNFVSFGTGAMFGAARTGAKQLAGMTTRQAIRQGVAQGAMVGAAENMIGTGLENLLIYPDLNSRGEDLGVQDYFMDIVMAGALGGLLGGAGGALGGWRGKKAADAEQRLIERGQAIAESLRRDMIARADANHLTLDNDFLWRAGDMTADLSGREFAASPDNGFLSRFGEDNSNALARDLPDRVFTETGADGEAVAVRRREFRWEEEAGEWRQAMLDAGYTPEQADANVRLLGAEAEVVAGMHGMDPRDYVASRLEVAAVAGDAGLRARQALFYGDRPDLGPGQEPQAWSAPEQIGAFIDEAAASLGDDGRAVLDILRNNGLVEMAPGLDLRAVSGEIDRTARFLRSLTDQNLPLSALRDDLVYNLNGRNLLAGMEGLGIDLPTAQAALRELAPVLDDVAARIEKARSGVHPDTLFMTAILNQNDPRITWRNGTHNVTVQGINIPLLPEGSRKHAVAKLKELQGKWIDDARVGRVRITKEGIGENMAARSTEDFSSFEYTAEIIRNAEWFRNDPNITQGKGNVIHAVTPLRMGRKGDYVAIVTFKEKLTAKEGE